MADVAVKVVAIPNSVKAATVEIRDELTWLIDEFNQLTEAEDMGEFADVLATVMEYVEDVHSALEGLEQVVKKLA